MTEYYKQPFNNTVPELVKVSNWEDDETKNETLTNVQEIAATVAAIEGNGETTNEKLVTLNSTVGTTGDADTATTVIGLLKSIVNKLS